MLRKNVVKGNAHRSLRLGKSLALRIGTVAHQSQHAFFADLCKSLKINGVSEYRRVIHLKVSGVNHDPCRRIDGKSRRILDAVVGLDKLNPEMSQIDGLPVAHHFSPGAAQKIVFRQFPFNDTHGQLGRVNGQVHFPQYIRQRSDMVLMAVGDHKPFYLLNIVLQIGHVRDHKVDSQHILLRESQTAIHDNNTVFVLKGSDVHSDLFQSSERNDAQFSVVFFFQIYTSTC